jgi:hypothetical protein
MSRRKLPEGMLLLSQESNVKHKLREEMKKVPYYTEDILVEKMQNGEYGWLDYVNHFSEDWQNEYEEYCKKHAMCIGNESAEQFVKYKDELLEQGMEKENA